MIDADLDLRLPLGRGRVSDERRAERDVRLGAIGSSKDMVITPHAAIAWRYTFDNLTTPDAALVFSNMGTGVPVAQNSALIDAGLDLNLDPHALSRMPGSSPRTCRTTP
jgi:hypothetical protein